MHQGAEERQADANALPGRVPLVRRRTPLVPKEMILPVCQRLAFVLFAMCSTALGIRLYARYKLGTLGGHPSGRLTPLSPLGNATHFFLDIGSYTGRTGSSQTKALEESGWKGVCAKPFPDAERACQPVSMPVVPVDGDQVMVSDCTEQTSPLQVVLSTFRNCDKVPRNGLGIKELMTVSKAPRIIDFVHLDTDGSEEEILKKFPFDEYCVRSWALNKASPDSNIPKLLESQNCKMKEAPTGYWARCSCAHFGDSLLEKKKSGVASLLNNLKSKGMPRKANREKRKVQSQASGQLVQESIEENVGMETMMRRFRA